MDVILIALLVLLFTMQSFLTKQFSTSYPGDEKNSSSVFTVVSGTFTVIVSVCFAFISTQGSASLVPEWPTLLLGIINIAMLVGYNYAIVKASTSGPYSVLMVFVLGGGIVLPTIVDVIFFNLVPTWQQVIAIVVIIVAIYLVSAKDGEKKSIKKSFIPTCILLAIFNGAYTSIISSQQKIVETPGQKESIIIITYLGAVLASLIPLLVKEKKNFASVMKQSKRSLIFLIASSLCVAFGIIALSVSLAFIENDNLVYTFDNAGVMVASVLASVIFLKEKLSLKNIIGCVIMCAALICFAVFAP